MPHTLTALAQLVLGGTVSGDATSELLAILEADPEYLWGFMADFGGDASSYIALEEGEEVDFMAITPTQLGGALRQAMGVVTPDALPADFDLGAVDWTAVGEGLDPILASSFGAG